MKIGKLIIERKTNAQIRAEKQQHIDTIRRGGFRKTADREQAKLDRRGKLCTPRSCTGAANGPAQPTT